MARAEKNTLREHWEKFSPLVKGHRVTLHRKGEKIKWSGLRILDVINHCRNGTFEIELISEKERITINDLNPWLVEAVQPNL